jgi:hypothetical protein
LTRDVAPTALSRCSNRSRNQASQAFDPDLPVFEAVLANRQRPLALFSRLLGGKVK